MSVCLCVLMSSLPLMQRVMIAVLGPPAAQHSARHTTLISQNLAQGLHRYHCLGRCLVLR